MVDRFYGNMERFPDESGQWVRFSDYKALGSENERLMAELHSRINWWSEEYSKVCDRANASEAREATAVEDTQRVREALTPSADTKAAYWGEFYVGVTLRAGREEDYRRVQIPWDSIKEIMAAIRVRALPTEVQNG